MTEVFCEAELFRKDEKRLATEKANAEKASLALLKSLGKVWPCGHHRNERTTQRVDNIIRCRICRRKRWNTGFVISLARRRMADSQQQRHDTNDVDGRTLIGAERGHKNYKALHHPENGRLPLDILLLEAASAFGLKADDLKGKIRKRPYVWARAVVSRILKERGLSYPVIGRVLGGRDHSTIIYQVRNFDVFERLDPRVTDAYLMLRDRSPVNG